MSDRNVYIKNEFNQHVTIPKSEVENDLNKQLEATKTNLQEANSKVAEFEARLRRAEEAAADLRKQLAAAKDGSGMAALEEELEQFRESASQAAYEFESLVETLNLRKYNGASVDRSFKEKFDKLLEDIENGRATVAQAMFEVKKDFGYLLQETFSESGAGINTDFLQQVIAIINRLQDSVSALNQKMEYLQTNGVKSSGGAGGDLTAFLDKITAHAENMSDSVREAYGQITRLVEAMMGFANINDNQMLGVSQTFRSLASIGQGSYGTKTIENIINLARRLQEISASGGVIRIDYSGLEAFNNLKVSKSSLKNLAEYLPVIDKVDTANINRLAGIDFTPLNNLKVSKAAVDNIIRMMGAVNGGTTSEFMSGTLSAVQRIDEAVNAINNDLSSLVTNIGSQISEAITRVASGVETMSQKTSGGSAGVSKQQAGVSSTNTAVYLGRYTDALNDATNAKVHDSLTGLGIAAKDADVISQHLSDMNIKVRSITPEWETITKIIDDEIIKEQKLKQITVQGTTALGDAVNHVIKFSAKTGEISKEITRATVKGKEFKQTVKELADGTKETNIETTVAQLKEIDGLIKSIEKTNSTLNSSKNKATDLLGGLSTTGRNREDLDAINKKYDELMVATERLKTQRMTANQEDVDGLRKIQIELDALIRKSLERLSAEAEVQKAIEKINVSYSKLNAPTDATKAIYDSIIQNRKELDSVYKQLTSGGLSSEERNAALERARALIQSINVQIKEQADLEEKAAAAEAKRHIEAKEGEATEKRRIALQKKYNSLLAQMEQAERNWSSARNGKGAAAYKGIQDDIATLKALRSQIESTDPKIDELDKKLRDIEVSFKKNSAAIKEFGKDSKSFINRIGSLGQKFATWFGVTKVISYATRSIRNMFTAVKDIDAAMTQFRIVTKISSSELSDFSARALEASKAIGSSVVDLTNNATTYARLGYTMDESLNLSKFTSMLSNVGDIDTSKAQDAITSIIKAYNIDTSQIEQVMDKLIATGNAFPISVDQIADGMTNASSALAAAGNSFEQSVALLTAANTTIQNSSKASTGLRTIAARIRNTKTDLDELGEAVTDADYEKIVKGLTDLNVSLKDSNGEFRSTYDIIKDIAAQWDKMSSMEQAGLAETLAGTRQQAIFFSLVGQFKEASGAMDSMDQSAGALSKAYSSYLDSTKAKLGQLKASFEGFSQSIISSDFMSFLTSSGANILSWLSDVINKFHLLPTLIVAAATSLSAFKNIGRDRMFSLKMNMPIVIIVLTGYGQFRYYAHCDTMG